MSGLFYRLADTTDPEERLEDASLWKAMRDHYGAGITLLPTASRAPDEGVTFGRTRFFEHAGSVRYPAVLEYWKDPGFAFSAKRRFLSCDLEKAEEAVSEIHASGKDAFVKAREQKLMTLVVPRGKRLTAMLGDMCWSFIDNPNSLLVQERVEMRNERRFVVMGGEIVTSSPVQPSLTPMSRFTYLENFGLRIDDIHFETPDSLVPRHDPGLSERMTAHAEQVVKRAASKNMIVDLCTIGDRVEVIEFNPMQPGMFGLFACRPDLIAAASERLLDPVLLADVLARRESGEEFPIPDGPKAARTDSETDDFSFEDPS